MNREPVIAALAALTLAAAATPANAWGHRTAGYYDAPGYDCVCRYRYTWGAWDDPYYWRRPFDRRVHVDRVWREVTRDVRRDRREVHRKVRRVGTSRSSRAAAACCRSD